MTGLVTPSPWRTALNRTRSFPADVFGPGRAGPVAISPPAVSISTGCSSGSCMALSSLFASEAYVGRPHPTGVSAPLHLGRPAPFTGSVMTAPVADRAGPTHPRGVRESLVRLD